MRYSLVYNTVNFEWNFSLYRLHRVCELEAPQVSITAETMILQNAAVTVITLLCSWNLRTEQRRNS